MSKIEMGKTYKTTGGKCSGDPVALVHVDEHFAVGYVADDWVGIWITSDGSPLLGMEDRGHLVEVKPTITRTYFTVHWEDGWEAAAASFDTKEKALAYCKQVHARAIGITGPHTITFTKGEGL